MSMPALFVGHGSPMNAIEDNEFTREWKLLGKKYQPKAILMVSAHWYTAGTLTQDIEDPPVINDMYGFPEELYRVNYQAKGSSELTQAVLNSVKSRQVQIRNDWGIDHGAWSVLVHMYPDRSIPIVQLSVDAHATPEEHLAIGRELAGLREKGIMVIGSGNIVHNLRMVDFHSNSGYDWSADFDGYIRNSILENNINKVVNFTDAGQSARLAVPTPDHFSPVFYALGAKLPDDYIRVFNDACTMGSLSMTSYIFE